MNNYLKKKVTELNGKQDVKEVLDAWRAGYIFAQSIIRKSFQEDYQDEFLTRVEEFIEDNLDEFEEWK